MNNTKSTNLVGFNAAGNAGSVSRAETIGQSTLGRITVWGSVWVLLHRTSVLVGFVLTVGLVVTEQSLVYTLSITARQFTFGTHWLVGFQDGQYFARSCK